MANAIKLLDVVALTVDLLEYHLWRGQVGTVVEMLAGERRVSCCTKYDSTYAEGPCKTRSPRGQGETEL